MSDFRLQIPQFAFINAQIIQEIIPSIRERVINIAYRLYPVLGNSYEFQNPAYIVSLLYCLLVVPQEIWLTSKAAPELNKFLSDFKPENYFELNDVKQNDKNQLKFIRRLRNSIAHARFSINNDYSFEFQDCKPGKPIDFKISISVINLMKFLSEVGAFLANLRSL